MKIKDAEWVNLYVDEGKDSKKAIDLLTEKGITFGERKWTGEFRVNVTIRGEDGRNLGAATTFPPPVLEAYPGPGKYLVLQGLDKILEEIECDW